MVVRFYQWIFRTSDIGGLTSVFADFWAQSNEYRDWNKTFLESTIRVSNASSYMQLQCRDLLKARKLADQSDPFVRFATLLFEFVVNTADTV